MVWVYTEVGNAQSKATLQKWALGDVPGGSDVKVSAYYAGDPSSIPALGRSSGEGNNKNEL